MVARYVPQKDPRGGKRDGAGRPVGSPNKLTAVLKDAVLMAAEQIGGYTINQETGKRKRGKGGVVAFLVAAGLESPNALIGMLSKIMPTQVTGPNDGPLVYADISYEELKKIPDDELGQKIALLQNGMNGGRPRVVGNGEAYARMLKGPTQGSA